VEATDPLLEKLYKRLMEVLNEASCQPGSFQLLEVQPFEQSTTFQDCLAFTWLDDAEHRWLVGVNFSDHASQCSIKMPFPELTGKSFILQERFEPGSYERNGDYLLEYGENALFDPWGYKVYRLLDRNG
jgi:hypothetical protein